MAFRKALNSQLLQESCPADLPGFNVCIGRVKTEARFGCFVSRFLFFCVCLLGRSHFLVSDSELCISGRAVFTVELYLQTERLLIFGAETQETQHDWIQALTKVTQFADTVHNDTCKQLFSLCLQ